MFAIRFVIACFTLNLLERAGALRWPYGSYRHAALSASTMHAKEMRQPDLAEGSSIVKLSYTALMKKHARHIIPLSPPKKCARAVMQWMDYSDKGKALS